MPLSAESAPEPTLNIPIDVVSFIATKAKEFDAKELQTIREILAGVTPLRKDCGGLVVAFLTPLPPLPFLKELEVCTLDVRLRLNQWVDYVRLARYYRHVAVSHKCALTRDWALCIHWSCNHR